MKIQKTLRCFALAAVAGLLVSNGVAQQVTVSQIPGYANADGEFNVTPVVGAGYAPDVVVGGGFESFCIYRDTGIPLPGTFFYSISSAGIYLPPGLTISKGTALLYSQFAGGTLSGYHYAGSGIIDPGHTLSERAEDADLLQYAFWTLEGQFSYGVGDPDPQSNYSLTQDLLRNVWVNMAANNFGGGTSGLLAAMADNNAGDYNVGVLNLNEINPGGSVGRVVQPLLTLLSSCTGQIGDFVWQDTNGNGCQDAGEPGIPNVQVDLYTGCGPNAVFLKSTTTDADGKYLFTGLCAGTYSVHFHTPAGFVHTLALQSCNIGGQPSNQTDSNCQCTGADDCDVCVTLPTDNTQDLTIDCGYIGNLPCLKLTKTADSTTATSGGQMGYTYAITNCGGTTYTNLAIIDDAGTPGVPGDDFTVATNINLLPGQGTGFHVVVALPIALCATNTTPPSSAGTLVAQVLPNGDVKVTFRQSRNLNDNVYGTNAPADGWSSHTFGNLTGSDKAEFRFTDGTSKVVLDFFSDYVSATTSNLTYPSGYRSLGPNGGDGSPVTGAASNVIFYTSTLADNLNNPANGGFPSKYTVNSPTPEASFPMWDYVDGYTVIVSSNAFGTAGFGGVTLVQVHNSPAKTGSNQVFPGPCGACITNIASVVTVSGGNITGVLDTDSAIVCTGDTNSTPPPTCLITKGALKIDKKTIQLPLKNNGASDIFLTEVDLAWLQSVNGNLVKISLNGDLWVGSAGSPVALTSGFNADANRRKIAKGQTKTLVLTFQNNASKVLTDYSGGAAKFGTCVVNIP